MNEGKRLVKNTIIITIGNIGTKLLSFFMIPFYTAYLDKAQFGVYDYLALVALFLIPISTCLLDESLFRFLIDAKKADDEKNIISNALLGQILSIIFFSCMGYFFCKYLGQIIYMYVFAYIISVAFCNAINSFLRGTGQFKKYAVFSAALSLLFTVFSLIFILFYDYKVEGLFLANIISHISIALLFGMNIKLWRYIDLSQFSVRKVYMMLKYSLPLIPSKLSNYTIELINRTFVIQMLGAATAGLFAIAYKLPLIITTIYGFFGMSWQESASRIVDNNKAIDFFRDVHNKIDILLRCICMITLSCTPILFRFFINSDYYRATEFVPFMLISTYFACKSLFWSGILTALKNTTTIGLCTLIGATINVLSLYFFISLYGAYGVVISMTIGNIISCFLLKRKVQAMFKFENNIKYEMLTFLIGSIIVMFYFSQYSLLQCLNILLALFYSVWSLKMNGLHKDIFRKLYHKYKV